MRITNGFVFGLILLVQIFCGASVRAEDGYRLWLRYDPLPAEARERYRMAVTSIIVTGRSATLDAARQELSDACEGLLARPVPTNGETTINGSVVVGTPQSSPFIAKLNWDKKLAALGDEGFRIATVKNNKQTVTVVASLGEVGALYGTFHFLRLLQTLQPVEQLNINQKPSLHLRLLNHWDNLDGSIERGYAGKSLWDWNSLPQKVDGRLRDYARANASIGINGSVLNNVNASSQFLTAEYLRKVSAIADVFRPYGVRVYLSARFSAPMELGKLPTADPLDPGVQAWWKSKVDEIYRLIPDFGGFLVKANSEGQPGPRTYQRNHVQGANMLAAAVAPHHGVVIWRAFVYDPKPDYDRAAAAFDELQPFDGHFAPNVLLQVKNGPIDFQPREPFHPLFGSMPRTQLMPELQITQEYLGAENHLVFLAPMWREFLSADTYARGRGSAVTKVIDGSLYQQRLTGMAGVANTGSDRNWTGHHFAQANWYALGRLAWNPELDSQQIAAEWAAMTFTHDAQALSTITGMMLRSHEAVVNYMTPLGLHHIMWPNHHYGPAPWWDKFERHDWNPVYYHRADSSGVGFERTAKGSNQVSQYQPPVRRQFEDLQLCPEKFLLWFHHVSWDYRLRSGRTLWDELCLHYQDGVERTRQAKREWETLKKFIDPQRHAEIAEKLTRQELEAIWWKDAVLTYFQTFSKRPLPDKVEKPRETLDVYQTRNLRK